MPGIIRTAVFAVAVRGGVQIPIAEGLDGDQATSDYRALIELVYHF